MKIKQNNKFSGSFDIHLSSANRSMCVILNKCYKMHLPLDTELELFDKIVEPILLHRCEIWMRIYGFYNIERI